MTESDPAQNEIKTEKYGNFCFKTIISVEIIILTDWNDKRPDFSNLAPISRLSGPLFAQSANPDVSATMSI